MISILDTWHRRWWQPDPAALAPYAGLRPVVLITGASEGIGYALARQFARAHNDLLLVARTASNLAVAAERLRADFGVEVSTLALDITDEDAVARLDDALARTQSYADVVVNCAGIGLSGLFVGHDAEKIMHLVDLNVSALTRLTRHFLPPMCVRGRGGVLNLASIGSYAPGPHQAVYYASKAYVLSLTEAIAAETAGLGVRVCALAPGPVGTGFHARMGAENALYRMIVPPALVGVVAGLGYLGFRLGLRVVLPGVLTLMAAVAMRILPHRILLPIIALLLKPRG